VVNCEAFPWQHWGYWVYLVVQSSSRLRLRGRIEEEDLGRGGKLSGHGRSEMVQLFFLTAAEGSALQQDLT